MKHLINLSGIRFGKLVVTTRNHAKSTPKHTYWNYACDCGNTGASSSQALRDGRTKSCGCSKFVHGLCHGRFYSVFRGMLARCNRESSLCFGRYGGRGIRVLWKDAKSFKEDMYESYLEHVGVYGEENTTIDRIDNDGPYCKTNCRWATRIENQANRRCNRFVEYMGERITATELARRVGLSKRVVFHRLWRDWPVELIVSTPVVPRHLRYRYTTGGKTV